MEHREQGLFFDEFKIGDKFFSDRRMITEADIDNFASISGDYNPIHFDTEYANTTLYGERIAHGLMGLSIVSGLAFELGFAKRTTVAFRGLNWKFKKPIRIGDKINAVFEVGDKRDLPLEDAGLIIFRIYIENQDGKKVQSGKWSLIIKKK